MFASKKNLLAIGVAVLAVVAVFLFLKKPPADIPPSTEEVAATTSAAPAAETTAPETPPPAAETPPAQAASIGDEATVNVAEVMQDRFIGKADAPVTITEYASMTCSHCAHFAVNVLPDFKKQLVETGKVRLIFRDFPLDGTALKAAMMARCAPADKYFSLVEVIFSNQERWVSAKDPMESLAQLGALAGIGPARFKACTENKELETAILDAMKTGQEKHGVQSTPTFVFNDGAETVTGGQKVEVFENVVNKLTNGK